MVNQNEFFREVTLRIGSSLNMDEALENLLEYLKDFFPLETIFLDYQERDGGVYSVSFAGGNKNRIFDNQKPMFFIESHRKQKLEKLLDQSGFKIGDVFIINQSAHDKVSDKMRAVFEMMREVIPPGEPLPSILSLELVIKDEIVGRFGIVNYEKNAFTEEHARLLQLVKEPIAIAMSNARRYRELMRLKDILDDDNRAMRQELERISGNEVIGADFGLRRVMELVRQAAPLNNPILLLGETGSGKEVIANAIHLSSLRRDRPMVRVQCGAIPDSLLDSELFGHEKGAFTGAFAAKRGRFERADGGTIFLDEIGELTQDAQVKLLRVLQEREFERLGGQKTLTVDVRVVAATHRNLERMVQEGRFREDLWYRLNVFPIQLPPLRQRKEDIPSLIAHFVSRKSREMGLPSMPLLAPKALDQLQAYDWPGNVRELQNVVERALITCGGGALSFPELEGYKELSKPAATKEYEGDEVPKLDDVIIGHIRDVLYRCQGRVEGRGGAAEVLGVNPGTLRARMRKYRIPFGRKAMEAGEQRG